MATLESQPTGNQEMIPCFQGEKTQWHGYDRYDFLIDEQTGAIKRITAQDDEKCEDNDHTNHYHTVEGQRRGIVVVPKEPASGNPWSGRLAALGPDMTKRAATGHDPVIGQEPS